MAFCTATITLALLVALLPCEADAGTLYGMLDTGELYASTNGGMSWNIRSTLPVDDAVALAAGSTTTQLFMASESGSFYASLDGGMSWVAMSAIPATDVSALVSVPGRLLIITASGAVYSSVDEGASFAAVGSIAASTVVSATRQGGSYFALTRTGEVYRSTNAGATWAIAGVVATSEAVEIVAFSNMLYVLTSTGDIARSDFTGAAWSFVSTLSQSGMSTLTAGEGELVASTEVGEIAASSSGTSWTWRGAIGQLAVRALGTDTPTTTSVSGSPQRGLKLSSPWPNPAQGRVVLALDLSEEAETTVEVLDAAGRIVAAPIRHERFPAGRVTRVWQPEKLPVGTYFLRARIEGSVQTRSLIWLGTR